MTDAVVVQSRLAPAVDRIIEPMLDLAQCSKLNGIVVVGANSAELLLELRRRGYVRVATTTNSGVPAGQYDVALVDWRKRPIKALDTTLDWLVDFLSPWSMLVVWIDPQEPAANRKLRSLLEKHGLVIEASTVCEYGSAVSAQRSEMKAISKWRKVA
jgi:acetolactate synthase regulatory subunit